MFSVTVAWTHGACLLMTRPCVNITEEPAEEDWHCPKCTNNGPPTKKKKKKKKRENWFASLITGVIFVNIVIIKLNENRSTDFKQDFANPISGRSVKNCLGYLAFHLLYICMKFKWPLLASTFFKRHPLLSVSWCYVLFRIFLDRLDVFKLLFKWKCWFVQVIKSKCDLYLGFLFAMADLTKVIKILVETFIVVSDISRSEKYVLYTQDGNFYFLWSAVSALSQLKLFVYAYFL